MGRGGSDLGRWARSRAGSAGARIGGLPLASAYAGVLQHARPLANAWAAGVVRGLRSGGGPSLDPGSLPRVERESGPVRITRGRVAAYLALTDGQDLDLERTRLVPPVYFTTWSLGPFLGVLADRRLGLSLLGLVHLENELVVHRPIRPDDRPTCRVRLDRVERTDRGLELIVLGENRVGETLASESRSLLLVRSKKRQERPATAREPRGSGDSESASSNPELGSDAPPDWETIREISLAANLGRRYGWLVGDVNPIHLSGPTARLFGFRQAILHGFCLKGMVAHALIRALGGGDPARLERLQIRFRKPAYLPGRVRVQVSGDRYEVRASHGDRLHAEGWFAMGSRDP